MPIRLNIVSEVALEGSNPRPIHMFRPGTFTDMNGRETSFTLEDVATITARFTGRRKPPITERHDFGQAIGRLHDVWADEQGNLYGMPKWNAKGRALLADEVYDGFSCELDRDENGWTLIGGSLTNYPAVGGLEPVTLAAPPLRTIEPVSLPSDLEAQQIKHLLTLDISEDVRRVATNFLEETQASFDTPATSTPLADVLKAKEQVASLLAAPPAPAPARPDIQLQQEQHTMSEPTTVELAAPALPPIITDPSVQAQVDAFLAQHAAQMEQQKRSLEAQVKADFERKMLEAEQRNQIHAFARSATITTADQPYALSTSPAELAQLLLETPSIVRGKWMTLIGRVVRGDGVVSFDEIGSSGDGGEDTDRWSILVNAKVAAGLSRVEAIRAVGREYPDLYAAQNKKGGR